MTLVSDLNKGSLCASKVSVPLVSGAQQGRERGGEREREIERGEEKRAGFILYLRVPVSRGVMSNDSCFAVHCCFAPRCSNMCKHA